jgi:hypothetical protein
MRKNVETRHVGIPPVGWGPPGTESAGSAAPARSPRGQLGKFVRWPSADLSSIRFVITGGAPVPERLILPGCRLSADQRAMAANQDATEPKNSLC